MLIVLGHPFIGSDPEVVAVVPVVLEEALRDGSSGGPADGFNPSSPRARSSGSDHFGSNLSIFEVEG